MFGRKKGDAFEWHKYVRTTIKLRREDRRRRIDNVKDAAVEGLKDASRAGVSAGLGWLDRLNAALFAPIGWISRGISGLLHGIVWLLERPLTPVARGLEQRGVGPMLALVAVVSGLLGLGRASVEGFDQVAILQLAAAGVIAALLIVPPLVTGRGLPIIAAIPGHLDAIRNKIPALSGLSVSSQRAVTAIGIGIVAIGGSLAALAAMGHLPIGRIATLPSLPGLGRTVVEGRATATSGDTLRIAGRLISLAGIEAPEADQQCGGQRKERPWKCGAAAQTALQEMVRNKPVRCEIASTRDSGEAVATCMIETRDIAAELVSRGHVFAEAGLFSSYGRLEADARNAKLGLWRGSSERPSDYRARLWEVARKSAPDGCPIKGHVTAGARIYVVPWQPSYGRIKVEASRGGRWFCSESEAQAAGWRPVDRS